MTLTLEKHGVFKTHSGKRVKISGFIKTIAVLRDSVTGDLSGEIQFIASDGSKKCAQFPMSAFIGRNQRQIVDTLANKGYRWPRKSSDCRDIIDSLADSTPPEFVSVDACGWHGEAFLTPREQFPGKPDILRLSPSNHHRAAYILGPGSLERWQKTVAGLATRSVSLRIAICASFAAPLLKPLGMPAFGINFFGPTSQGKTSLLYGASSVAGLIANGLPTWADTMAATDEMLLGYRDCILPLDETGDGGGRDVSIGEKVRMLSFSISRKRLRTRSSTYEQSIGIRTRDYRTIILSTSERALDEIANEHGSPRLAGAQVRFFDFPATQNSSMGIFQRPSKHLRSIDPLTAGKSMADGLRNDANENQGHAIAAFLERLVVDSKAIDTLRNSINFFHRCGIETDPASLRMKDSFALLYAAGCLAIDYAIVPWKRRALLVDIVQAWELVRSRFWSKSLGAQSPAREVSAALDKLNLVDLKNFSGGPSELTDCDGFLFKGLYFVRGRALPRLCRNHAHWLIRNKIQITEGRRDACTVAKRLPNVDGKRRYYVYGKRALSNALDKS